MQDAVADLLVQHELGRIPKVGEEVHIANCRLVIHEADPRVIKSVNIFKEDKHPTTHEPMVDLDKRRLAATPVGPRSVVHAATIDQLNETGFDAATCILVSHFILKREERVAFFAEIASRLKSGGLLVSADISSDMQSEEFQSLLPIWCKALSHSGHDPETVKSYVAALGTGASVLPPAEVASIIRDGGFAQTTLFYQSLLIHGWLSRKA